MIKSKKELVCHKIGDQLLYQDEYIGLDFVMDYLEVGQSSAYHILGEIRKLLARKYGYTNIANGRATLSGFYEYIGLKGKFE